MDTPICDFVKEYQERGGLRLHMPGHKGAPFLGVEQLDITEIQGADELYHPEGIIKKSQENASLLFGTGRTLYSTEGSSLCIRAMLYLALLWSKEAGRTPLVLAGRNAHKTFLSAAALLDFQVEWLYPKEAEGPVSCVIESENLEERLSSLPHPPMAVYITSPDYLGHLSDVASLSRICKKHGVPLIVDNAHGAYLKFLPKDLHPIALGADLCCDSAHKTLPCLTGGAYLHISSSAPALFFQNAERAMRLFASTSPSYLILQSLDRCNLYLSEDYPERLKRLCGRVRQMKDRLSSGGYTLIGDESLKLTIAAKPYGYTGDALHDLLRRKRAEFEFSDPDYLTAMLTPENDERQLDDLENALLSVEKRAPVLSSPPTVPKPQRVMSIRRAMLSPAHLLPIDRAQGSVFADAHFGCPPCVPVIVCGERIDEAAVSALSYYGIRECAVITE